MGVASSQSGESFKTPYGSILHLVSAEFFGRTGRQDCPRAEWTIELDPPPPDHLPRRTAQTRLLRRDVPHRTLEHPHPRQKIGAMLFERTALSRNPAKLGAMELKKLREEDKLTPDPVFRDPYFLDFLKLKDTYAEKDIEAAILREMEAFILELGVGFAFLERQKRMQIGNKDYYLDLLFYHRKLRRLIAIDLKLEEFVAADKGQMELYLNWLKKHEQSADEAEPLGIILCAGKDAEHVELLELEKSGIHVARNLINFVTKKQIERKPHEALRLARARLAEMIGTAKAKPVDKQPRIKKTCPSPLLDSKPRL